MKVSKRRFMTFAYSSFLSLHIDLVRSFVYSVVSALRGIDQYSHTAQFLLAVVPVCLVRLGFLAACQRRLGALQKCLPFEHRNYRTCWAWLSPSVKLRNMCIESDDGRHHDWQQDGWHAWLPYIGCVDTNVRGQGRTPESSYEGIRCKNLYFHGFMIVRDSGKHGYLQPRYILLDW